MNFFSPLQNEKLKRVEENEKKIPPNPEGLASNVNVLTETPEEMLQRVLLPDEKLVATFDCMFPTFMLPRWKLMLLLIFTLGLYGFVLLYRSIARWCYKMKCCTPAVVDFQRGKLAITTRGRLICWSLDFEQVKEQRGCCIGLCYKCCCCCCGELCNPAVTYGGQIATRIYNSKDIRQITQSYESSSVNPCCWCCCIEYECMVSISFGEFSHNNYQTGMVSTNANFLDALSNSVHAIISGIEGRLGLGDTKTLYVYSKKEDMVHNGDVNGVIEDMGYLYRDILEALPSPPDVFVKNDELISQQINKWSNSEQFIGTTIVGNNGDVAIPKSWFELLPGEEIISAHGELWKMKCLDWCFSIWTLGGYYCTYLRKKRFERSAIILTTKRIVVIDINQRAGMVPSHLSEVGVYVRSFLPGDVLGGYINSPTKTELDCGINTLGGHIFITFPTSKRKAIPFAKSLMMATSRERSTLSLDLESGHMPPSFDLTDYKALPLLVGEKPVATVEGDTDYLPCCLGPPQFIINALCCGCFKPFYCCSAECIGKPCFPWLPYMLSLCLRPFIGRHDTIITEKTVITYVNERNYGIFGCCGELCPNACDGDLGCNVTKFSLAWAPLSQVSGHNSLVSVVGRDSCWTRCCVNNVCGRYCCPNGFARLEFDVDLGKYSFRIHDDKKNHDFNKKDPKLKNANMLMGQIELQLQSKSN